MTKTGGNQVDLFCRMKKSYTRPFTFAQSLEANQTLEVQINDQAGPEVLFYVEVVLSPGVSFAVLPVRASLPLDSLSSSPNAPTHELGVLPAAVLPILTEHTVLLETLPALKHELKSHASKLSLGSRGSNLHLIGRPGRVLP